MGLPPTPEVYKPKEIELLKYFLDKKTDRLKMLMSRNSKTIARPKAGEVIKMSDRSYRVQANGEYRRIQEVLK